MGVCSSNQYKADNSEAINYIVKYFDQIYLLDQPDIPSLINRKLKEQQIIQRELSQSVIISVSNKLINKKIENKQQEEIKWKVNGIINVYKAISTVQGNFMELQTILLLTMLELLIYYGSVNKNRQKQQIWWTDEYFQWRRTRLQNIYGVLPNRSESNPMNSFLDCLWYCLDQESQSKQGLAYIQFYSQLKTDFLNTYPPNQITVLLGRPNQNTP